MAIAYLIFSQRGSPFRCLQLARDGIVQATSVRSIFLMWQEMTTIRIGDDFLAEVGYDPVFGARPLKRAMSALHVPQIAKAIKRGEFNDGDTIYVDVQNERLSFTRLPAELLTT